MKILPYIWLITLTILSLALCLHVKRNTAQVDELQAYYINTKDRVSVLELGFEHNQGRVEEAIKEWFQNRQIVPVGRGILLAVEREDEQND